MKKILLILPLALILIGCPAGTQQSAAKASLQVTIVMQSAQQGEIVAHNSGLIPDADHQFIQRSFQSLAEADKAANDCIGGATTKGAVLSCLNAAVNAVDGIQKEGGLALKSDNAKANFSFAITSIKGVLDAIIASFGGAA
jgi:hypothetical protein